MKRSKVGGLGLSRKGKKIINSNQRLLTISDNDRQLLLSDRVLNILDSAKKSEDYNFVFEAEKSVFQDVPERLKKYQCEKRTLWNRAGSLCDPEEEPKLQDLLVKSNSLKNVCVPNPEPIREVKDDQKSDHRGSLVKSEKSYSISKYFGKAEKTASHSQNDSVIEPQGVKIEDLDCDSQSSPNPAQSSSQHTGKEKSLFPIFDKSFSGTKNRRSNSAGSTSLSDGFDTVSVSSPSLIGVTIKAEKMGLFSKRGEKKISVCDKSDHTDLGADLLRMFVENIDTDITLYGREEKPIKAHKLILKARCPKLLQEAVDEKRTFGKSREVIALTCYSHLAVKCLMSYIYCGKVIPPGYDFLGITDDDLADIKDLGVKFGLKLEEAISVNLVGDQGARNHVAAASLEVKKSSEASCQTELASLAHVNVQTDPQEHTMASVHNQSVSMGSPVICFTPKDSYPAEIEVESDARSGSPDLFDDCEHGFSDKTFLNTSVHSQKSEHRSWRERTFRSASPIPDFSGMNDDDCIILEENFCVSPILPNGNANGWEENEVIPRPEPSPCWKADDKDATPAVPMTSIWNKTYDDQFFANLPTDEELLNFPPTSPSGAKTYSCQTPPLSAPIIRSPLQPLPKTPTLIEEPSKNTKKAVPKRKAKKSFDDLVDVQQPKKRINKGKKDNHQMSSTNQQDDDILDSQDSDSFPSSSQPSDLDVCRTPKASSQTVQTKQQSKNKTPMLNYSLIDTPILKKELKRYGLKPLPRSKAKIILRHIYTETHRD